MLPSAVREARELLESVTPLRSDCGAVCGGACCHSLPGDTTGMLLFPGEEAYYAGRPGYRMTATEQGTLLTCEGRCDRTDRPLSCRMFPLLPLMRPDGVKVATDQRALAVCPLARQGKDALQQDFVQAVRQVGCILSQDEAQAAFLRRLTAIHDELKALRRQFRSK